MSKSNTALSDGAAFTRRESAELLRAGVSKAMLLGDLVTKREAAELLRVSHWTITSWLSSGKLRRVKVGGRTLLARADLEAFLQAGRV